jgi:hypothetical protein
VVVQIIHNSRGRRIIFIGVFSSFILAAATQGSTQIFILGPEDGRQKIVDLARQFSREVLAHKLAHTDITVSRVDEMMQGKFVDVLKKNLIINNSFGDHITEHIPRKGYVGKCHVDAVTVKLQRGQSISL